MSNELMLKAKDVRANVTTLLKNIYPNNYQSTALIEMGYVANMLLPLLNDFDKNEISRVIVNAINAGLTFNPNVSELYLMPRYDSNLKKKVLVTVITQNGFKSLLKRALPDFSGYVFTAIRKDDKFDFSPTQLKRIVNFRPANLADDSKENVLGYYIEFLNTSGNAFIWHFMSKKDIDKRKSKATTQVVWNEWYEEMALKTIAKFVMIKMLTKDSKNPFLNAALEVLKENTEEAEHEVIQ